MRKMFLALILFLLITIPLHSQASRPMQILVIGDSLGYGLAANSIIDGFAHRVARDLNARLGLMTGVSLFQSEMLWDEWQWRDVDLIIVELALHDIGSDAGAIPDQDWPSRYGAFLDRLHQDTGAPIIVTTAFWAGVTMESDPERYNRTLLYNDFIRGEAASRGEFVRLADWWAITEGDITTLSRDVQNNPWKSLNFQGDGFHPGGYGHWVLAQEVLRVWNGWGYLPVADRK